MPIFISNADIGIKFTAIFPSESKFILFKAIIFYISNGIQVTTYILSINGYIIGAAKFPEDA